MTKAVTDPPAQASRSATIMELAVAVRYPRVPKLVARIGALAPFTSAELKQIIDIGVQTGRWEPARIAFYQDLLPRADADVDLRLSKRIHKLLSKVRTDLVVRLVKANNYPTARMYIDALRNFDDLTPAEVERIVIAMVESKRLAGMRLEPRQFLFFRDLLARHADQVSPLRVAHLIGILKTAVEKDPSLRQL